jgi:hypothetical protein
MNDIHSHHIYVRWEHVTDWLKGWVGHRTGADDVENKIVSVHASNYIQVAW